ncbi:MAG TPA: hypothetical protein VFS43_28655 [Polyangiaceae bacterium]|nr:hypothetical protein [Polyangiaceae bacterium]
MLVACAVGVTTLGACGDDDDDDNPSTAGRGGSAGSGGSSGAGGSGGGKMTFATCALAFEGCVADDVCNKIISCLTDCVAGGRDLVDSLKACTLAAGVDGLPAAASKIVNCASAGGACAPGSGTGGSGTGGAGGAGGGAGGAGGDAGGAGGAGGDAGGAGGAGGGAGGSGGSGPAPACPDVSEAAIKACSAGGTMQGPGPLFGCLCAN